MPRLEPGGAAPDISLPDADGQTVSLGDYSGRRVIVYFYPAASTPGCTTQACDFQDNVAALNRSGVDVLGVSPDVPQALARFRDEQGLRFPLLSDPDHAVLQAYGAWGEKTLYGRTSVGVIRSTVVVAADRTIELARYNVKATGHVDRLLRELDVPA